VGIGIKKGKADIGDCIYMVQVLAKGFKDKDSIEGNRALLASVSLIFTLLYIAII
jgi:hypothetical protein